MKKIAILRCLKTSASCAGAGCLRPVREQGVCVRFMSMIRLLHNMARRSCA